MSIALRDACTDADNTAATAHTLDSGGTWAALGGTCKISSNKMVPNSLSGTNSNASVKKDVGAADVAMGADFGSSNGCGLDVRVSADDVGWLCRNNAGTLEIYQMPSAGTYNLVASQAGADTGAHRLEVVARGATITVSVGAVACEYPSASLNAGVTAHGVRFDTAGQTADNVLVIGIAGSGGMLVHPGMTGGMRG